MVLFMERRNRSSPAVFVNSGLFLSPADNCLKDTRGTRHDNSPVSDGRPKSWGALQRAEDHLQPHAASWCGSTPTLGRVEGNISPL